MKWTKEKPTKEGWRWYRGEHPTLSYDKTHYVMTTSTKGIFIYIAKTERLSRHDLEACIIEVGRFDLNELDGEFSDQPIPEPEEAE